MAIAKVAPFAVEQVSLQASPVVRDFGGAAFPPRYSLERESLRSESARYSTLEQPCAMLNLMISLRIGKAVSTAVTGRLVVCTTPCLLESTMSCC